MRFCDKCGSYMRATTNGYKCTRCGSEVHADIVEVRRIEHQGPAIDVVEGTVREHAKVFEKCPRCGSPEAFRGLVSSAGEHAGVRQERSIERLTCTKCQYSWTKD